MSIRAAVVLRGALHAGAQALSDRELLQRYADDGDQAAFALLVARHGGMVLGVCRRVLPTVQDAEDATQATFLVLARKAKGGRWQASVANWLYTTARRMAANVRVAAARRAKREAAAAVPDRVESVDRMTGRELLAILDEELGRLPTVYREPLVLCYLEGLARQDAAARLDAPLATVKSRLERGRKRLGNALVKRGVVAGAGLLALVATSPAGAFPPRLVEAVLAAVAGEVPVAVAALAEGVAVNKSLWAAATLAVVATVGIGIGLGRQAPASPQEGKAMPAKQALVAEGKADVAKPQAVVVAGRVVRPDGKPVAGAKLYVPKLRVPQPTTPRDIGAEVVGESAADGSFRVAVPPLPGPVGGRDYLVAYAPGFAVDWIVASELPPGDVTLRLTKDVPITGRVVNTEGRPVAGVTVSAGSIYVPANDDLDSYLDGWKKNWRDIVGSPLKRLYLPLDAIVGETTTDADGKFAIRGAGREQVVHVAVAGAGLARDTVHVVTRPGFAAKAYNAAAANSEPAELRIPRQTPVLYGPDMQYIAEPGVTLEGKVTDAATGQPLAGAGVSVHIGFGDGVVARTGPDGSYRIGGIPKSKRGYNAFVSVGSGATTYLGRRVQIPDGDGLGPFRADVAVQRGAVVTGRVIDRQTGKGVLAGVRFAPLPDNTFFDSKPGYDNYKSDRTMQTTDADGRFRQVTIPGRAVVMAQVHGGLKFHGEHLNPYRHAEPDEADRKAFQYDKGDDMWTIATAGGLEILSTENAVKVIDIKETGETAVELFVERGSTATVAVQDAAGQPLTGAWVSGLTEHWPIAYKLPEPSATVYALTPTKPRTLVVYHPEKKLGGIVTIRGDETEPVAAKLGPLATVTGRLLDADGGPLAGAAVSVAARGTTGSELYRFAHPSGKPVVAGDDGRFTLPGVIPGLTFSVQVRKGQTFYTGKPRIGTRTLKPGETHDLGDRTMETLR
ncbi:MAG: sigma-70 family RNA polymerase sigma factor [Gemmataceae bacterium]